MRKAILAVVTLAVLILAAGAQAQTTCTAPPSGLVAWWPGDGDASDISGSGNNGTVVGTVNFPAGKVGQTFSFSGGGWVSVPSSTSLEPTAITVDAWVRRSGFPGGARYIVGKGGTACSHSSYALYTASAACGGNLAFYVARPGVVCSPPPTVNIYDGNWHHIAGTYDGSYVRLYIDGVEQGIGTLTSGQIDYGLPVSELRIGQYPVHTACSLPFPGDVDEVEIFNRALTLTEIQAIYNAGHLGKCKAPTVVVNIKPGSDPNSINTCSQGTTPVTIFGDDPAANGLDVTQIDQDQLTLASAAVKTVGKSGRTLCNIKDVGSYDESFFDKLNPDPDGYADLTCHFVTYDLTLEDTSTTADVSVVGCDDPNDADGCVSGDPGYFSVAVTDFVNIVRDCQ